MPSLCAGMFVFGIVMAMLGAILPSLFTKIQMDKAEAGNLFLYMNFAMLVASLIFGPVVDRFGFKIFLIVCSFFVALSFTMFTLASTYSLILAAVVVLGFGGGGLNGGTNALTSDIHPEKRSAALNVLGIFFGFGALFIPFLIGTLLNRMGLDLILLCAVSLSLLPFILYSALAFPRPKHTQGFPLKQAGKVLRHPLLWLCGFLLFFQSGNEFTIGGWISTYLNEQFRLTPMQASLVLAGYWAAIMAGRLVSSRIVNFLRNEHLLLGSACVSLFAAVLIIISGSGALASLGAVLLGLGFAAIFPTTLAVVAENFPSLTGTAFSAVFVIALAGGMTSPWLVGNIAQAHSLKLGLYLPVFNCSMIVILLYVVMNLRKSYKKIVFKRE